MGPDPRLEQRYDTTHEQECVESSMGWLAIDTWLEMDVWTETQMGRDASHERS